MKKIFCILLAIILIIIVFVSCDSNSNSSYSNNSSYGYGSKYDKDIGDIADAYGASPDEVNDLMNAMGGAMK